MYEIEGFKELFWDWKIFWGDLQISLGLKDFFWVLKTYFGTQILKYQCNKKQNFEFFVFKKKEKAYSFLYLSLIVLNFD